MHSFQSLLFLKNEDWQIIISHQLSPQNTSWWPLQGDLDKQQRAWMTVFAAD
jgi:hypothetical protein